MAATLYFYDLETSGRFADSDRIMQFAGQRTDLDLNPIGQAHNLLIRLNQDILPDPVAVLIHGITPQQTLDEGITEAEFLKFFYREVITPDTTIVGFNNVRFDDEFIRYINYRNLYDPYSWSYENGVTRWDVLDVIRLTRALRPDGIVWPKDDQGKNVNTLVLLAKANGLKHESAHDALSDVSATIELTKLVKQAQPKLFEYLFKLRAKTAAADLVNGYKPFVYTSSHYPSELLHTTIVTKVADHPKKNCSLVYDLRYDPTPWLNKTASELADAWRYTKNRDKTNPQLPIKTLRLNRCPAIAPLSVINEETAGRLKLDLAAVEVNRLKLDDSSFAPKIIQAVEILDREQTITQQKRKLPVDARLYESFYPDSDRRLLIQLHKNETPQLIRSQRSQFSDNRLKLLASLYLARNYLEELSETERSGWDKYVLRRLFYGGANSRLALYFQSIAQLSEQRINRRDQVLLEDLKLYGESLIPSDIID